MPNNNSLNLIGYVVTAITFFGAFLVLYNETGEIISSFTASLIGAVMVFGTFIVMKWLSQIF